MSIASTIPTPQQPIDNAGNFINRIWYNFLASLTSLQTADNLEANPGGGQANAVLLAADINRFTIVHSIGDSAKLPPSAAGLEVVVINDAAKQMQIFGSGTDTIDGVKTTTGVPLSAAKRAVFYCVTAKAWQSMSGGVSA